MTKAMTLPRHAIAALLALLCAGRAFAQTEPVELRVSWWGGNEVHRAQLESIRLFEERYPHIRVKPEYTGWNGHLERLTTQLAGGTAPDLMQINWAWLVLFSRDGRGFHDLEALAREIDLGEFDVEAVGFGRVHGRLNAIPTAMAARLFYFNATTFAKAGLAVPSTWEELLAAGPVFRERLGEEYFPLDVNFQDLTALARSWYVQKAHKPLVDEEAGSLTATPDELRELAAFYSMLVDRHVIPSARERASHGHVEPQEMRPWISGRYAGTYQWISAISKYVGTLAPGQQVVLARYPMHPGAADAGLLYRPAMMLAVSRNTRHPREAALLLNFFLNDPGAVRALGLKRGVPVSRAALETLRRDGVLKGLAWDGLRQVGTLPNAIRESGYFEHARVRDGFNDIFEALGYGRIDEQEAALRLDRDMNRILQRVIR
jgi:oligogalacturonide transport system substrate-binding protein